MLQVLLVFVADIFQQVRIERKFQRFGDGPRLAVCFRIINGESQLQVPEVRAPEAFRDVESLGGRWPVRSNHTLPLKPVLSSTRASLSHRPVEYSHPGGIRVYRKPAAIQIDLARRSHF